MENIFDHDHNMISEIQPPSPEQQLNLLQKSVNDLANDSNH
jgi:hypothetical protein